MIDGDAAPAAQALGRRRPIAGLGRDAVVLGLAAVALMLPSLAWGPGTIDSSLYNYVWARQFGEGLARGELYPRWLPRSFEGLGSPAFYFYPPLAFYLAGLFTAVGLKAAAAINATVLFATCGSGVAMRLWLAGRSPRPLLWSVIYMAAPYHLADWYQRAALAEYSAFVWLPLIALAITRLDRPWGPVLLAASYALLILTHLPLALLASLGLIAPAVLRQVWPMDLRRLAVSAAALSIGLALACGYLVPALTLQGHIAQDLLWLPKYRPENWSILAGPNPVGLDLRSWVLPIAATLIVLAVGALASRPAARSGAAFWALVALATAILALGLPPQAWTLPLVSKVQFPWRFLAITEFSALTAMAMVRSPSPPILALSAAVALVSYGRTAQLAEASLRRPHTFVRVDASMPDAIEYLPAGISPQAFDLAASLPDLSTLRVPLVQGGARVIDGGADGSLTLQVTTPGRIVVRRFYFPAWQVLREGRPIDAEPFGPGRLLSFQATPGAYRIARRMLPQEQLGWALSLFGLGGLAALSVSAAVRRPRAG